MMAAGNRALKAVTRLAAALFTAAALIPTAANPVAATPVPQLQRVGEHTLIVRITDSETQEPVSGVLVTLTSLMRRAVTNTEGAAIFEDLEPGDYEITMRHVAYGEVGTVLNVDDSSSTVANIPLRMRGFELDPLEVRVERRPLYLEERGFYERRDQGHGHFFDPHWVETRGVGLYVNVASSGRRAGLGLLDLVLGSSPKMPGGGVSSAPPGTGRYACPQVYIDGRPEAIDSGELGGATRELSMFSSSMIGAIEVYPSSAGLPLFALSPTMGCGTVVIWTNRWRGQPRELKTLEVELCDARDDASVSGHVSDELTGIRAPGSRVHYATYPRGRPQRALIGTTIADEAGRYRVCGLLAGQQFSASAEFAGYQGQERVTQIGPGVIHNLTIPAAGPGVVLGRVVDVESGRPLPGAEVVIEQQSIRGESSERRTITDRQGFYRIESVLPGDQHASVSSVGFAPLREPISVRADRTLELRISMTPDPVAIPGLVVTAIRERRLENRGFYDRRERGERIGSGDFMDEADVRRIGSATVSSVVSWVPGITAQCTGSGRDCRVGTTRSIGCTQMDVYLNGQLTIRADREQDLGINELVFPNEIAGLEVYRDASSLPAEFFGSRPRCGAVVIWTK